MVAVALLLVVMVLVLDTLAVLAEGPSSSSTAALPHISFVGYITFFC
jgi:hypothetical protein